MILYAVDPGTVQSALVITDGMRVISARLLLNPVLLAELTNPIVGLIAHKELVIEQIASFGMPVGAEVFATCWWSGRFYEAWPSASTRHQLPRSAVKMHLCQSMRAKDANIRQALMDRFGGSSAIGTKKAPGPLYGLRSHHWAALGVAVTWLDQHATGHPDANMGLSA